MKNTELCKVAMLAGLSRFAVPAGRGLAAGGKAILGAAGTGAQGLARGFETAGKTLGTAAQGVAQVAVPAAAKGLRYAGGKAQDYARFSAAVPQGQAFFSSPARSIYNIGKIGLAPNLGKRMNYLRYPVWGYSAKSIYDAGNYAQAKDTDTRQAAAELLNPDSGIRKAVAPVTPPRFTPPPQAKDILNQTKEKGLRGLITSYQQHKNELNPEVRKTLDDELNAQVKGIGQDVGYELRNTPAWHQTALQVTSPLQWFLRDKFLPTVPAAPSPLVQNLHKAMRGAGIDPARPVLSQAANTVNTARAAAQPQPTGDFGDNLAWLSRNTAAGRSVSANPIAQRTAEVSTRLAKLHKTLQEQGGAQ